MKGFTKRFLVALIVMIVPVSGHCLHQQQSL